MAQTDGGGGVWDVLCGSPLGGRRMAAGCLATGRLTVGCLVGLLLVGQRGALAQEGVLRGTVADSSGAPIEAADVAIVALHQLTRTDDRGRFALTGLPLEEVELSGGRARIRRHNRTLENVRLARFVRYPLCRSTFRRQ